MCFLQFNHPSLSDKEIKMTSLRIGDKESKPVNFSGKDPILKSYFKEVLLLIDSYSLIHFKSIESFQWTSVDFGAFFFCMKRATKVIGS